MSDALALLRFYMASSIVLLFTFPIVRFLFPKSPGHIVLYGRFIGLLLLNSCLLLLGSLGIVPFSFIGILIVLILLGFVGFLLWFKERQEQTSIKEWFHKNWETIVFDEIIFVFMLLLFAHMVAYHPKIFGTEKYMDFVFLNSLMRGTELPPLDPWFAGETINYYYGGYMIVALLGRLGGLPPQYAYNIALAFLFASAFALSWAFGTKLSHSRIRGLLAPLMVAVMGNLNGFLQVLRVGAPYKINYFESSRIIVDGVGKETGNTINEFPFFSFYHADLHPHVTAIPFVLIFIILLYETLLVFRSRHLREGKLGLAGRFFVIAIALGALGFINGLDLPTFGLLLAGITAVGALRMFTGRRHPTESPLKRFLIVAVGSATLVLVTGMVAYLFHAPFYRTFIAPSHPDGAFGWTIYKSNFGEFLTVFHLQLLLVIIYLTVQLTRASKESHPVLFRLSLISLAALFVFVFAIYGYFIVSFLLVLIPPLLYSIYRNFRRPDDLFLSGILFLAISILLGCEFIHVRDDYGRALQRMNTLFKFHYQAWILFGLSAPLILLQLKREKFLAPALKSILRIFVLILLALNLVYPFGVSWARLRETKQNLDGMAYLKREHPRDALGISWLNKNVEGSPVILECPGRKAYDYNARVSTNTGLPTLIGWINHEAIWRKKWVRETQSARETLTKANRSIDSWSMGNLRQSIADRIYKSTDFKSILPLLQEHQVKYIFVGELEQQYYNQEGMKKFNQNCQQVFFSPGIAIYKVPE